MAITRSQIARQLLAEGGAPNPRKPFANGGFDYESAAAFGSDVDDFGMDRVDSDEATPGGDVNFTPQGPSIIDRIGDSIENRRNQSIRNFTNRNMMTTRDAIFSLSPFGAKESNLFDLYREMEDDPDGVFAEGFTGTRLNPERARQTFETLSKSKEKRGLGIDLTKDIGSQLDKISTTDFRSAFNLNRNTGGDNNPIRGIPLIPKLPTDIEPEKSDMAEYIASVRGNRPNPFEVPEAYRLADGGEVRDGYFGGGITKAFKKVTGAVKKVAKSPVGKVALAVGLNFAPSLIPGGASTFLGGKNPMFAGFGLDFLKEGSAFREFLGTTPGKATAGIIGASLLAGAMTPKEEEESISQRIADRTGLDIEGIRKEVQDAYASGNTGSLRNKYPFLITQSAAAAEGGRIGFENGGYSFEQFKKDKFKVDQFMGEEQMRKMYEEMMRKKRVAEQRSMVANGGDIDEAPKEEGIMMASYGYDDAMSDTYDMFLQMKEKKLIPPGMDFQQFLQEVVPEMSMKKDTSGMMASAVGDESDDISRQLFGKGVKDLTPDEFKDLQEEIDRLMNKFRGAKGGIASMAEGGMMDLGGNEMDLRGGGFVPLGVAEKADDVPARLSKNEFVFTADAVRAAGGGSVDRGADLMYKTMKQLENKVA